MNFSNNKSTKLSKFTLNAKSRLLIFISISELVFLLLPKNINLVLKTIISYDSGMVSFLFLTFYVMLKSTPESMKKNAKWQNENSVTILFFLILAASLSFSAILYLLKQNVQHQILSVIAFHMLVFLVTIIGSWVLVHTAYALHYAHAYYLEEKPGGLDFGTINKTVVYEPVYLDFLYFSFTIGMTSQTSDVEVNSLIIRKFVLIHSIISFFFNTSILALSINIIGNTL